MISTLDAPIVGALFPYFRDPTWDEFLVTIPAGPLASDVQGLCRVAGARIDILAIAITPEGKGHGGRFLDALLANYRSVIVWEITNDILAGMLHRRGFVPYADCCGTGMRWDAA